ncbi:MAG: ABC transporter permease subunit [Coriobacteriales bacterium]|jgi:putative spermidine/putrescine transport system permease protein|nr:ABC transporter permease subunit [Coriobacteriales bacterium]
MMNPRLARILVCLQLVLVLLPLSVVAIWAFSASWPWPELLPQTFSIKGFTEIFRPSNDLPGVLGVSIFIALASAALATLVAALAARAVVHFDFVGKEVFKFATLLPFIIPSVVFAMGIQIAFIRMGLARTVLGVVIAHAIVSLPYAYAIMSDVTAAMGAKLEDAARTLGANKRQMLLQVTLPSLLPGLISSMSMSYILSFSQYFLTLLIGGGTVRTFMVSMFPFLTSGDRTVANAYGLVFLVVTFCVFLLFELLLKRFGYSSKQSFFNL